MTHTTSDAAVTPPRTPKQASLIDDLNLIENPQERLAIIVERARTAPTLPPAAHCEGNLVPGCLSQVWLLCEHDPQTARCRFRCDADGPLVKGLVALLCDYYSDSTPAEIVTGNTDLLAELGLLQTLSPTRRNGLAQVRARIHAFAASQKRGD